MMPETDCRYELAKGELIRLPFGTAQHGLVTINLAVPLYVHIEANNLGVTYAAGTGFKIESDPDTVLAPDISFVRIERRLVVPCPDNYRDGAPDLAVEVLEDSESVVGLEERVEAWLEAGARMVWLASPKMRTVTVYESMTDVVTLTDNDQLEGGEVVVGFSIAVAKIFGRQ